MICPFIPTRGLTKPKWIWPLVAAHIRLSPWRSLGETGGSRSWSSDAAISPRTSGPDLQQMFTTSPAAFALPLSPSCSWIFSTLRPFKASPPCNHTHSVQRRSLKCAAIGWYLLHLPAGRRKRSGESGSRSFWNAASSYVDFERLIMTSVCPRARVHEGVSARA